MSTKTRNKVRRIKTTDTLLETTCDLVNKRYICPLGPLACALYVRKKKKDYSWAHLDDTQRTRYAWYEKLACALFFQYSTSLTRLQLFCQAGAWQRCSSWQQSTSQLINRLTLFPFGDDQNTSFSDSWQYWRVADNWEYPENTYGVRTCSVHVYLDRHELSVSALVFLRCGERLRKMCLRV